MGAELQLTVFLTRIRNSNPSTPKPPPRNSSKERQTEAVLHQAKLECVEHLCVGIVRAIVADTRLVLAENAAHILRLIVVSTRVTCKVLMVVLPSWIVR